MKLFTIQVHELYRIIVKIFILWTVKQPFKTMLKSNQELPGQTVLEIVRLKKKRTHVNWRIIFKNVLWVPKLQRCKVSSSMFVYIF